MHWLVVIPTIVVVLFSLSFGLAVVIVSEMLAQSGHKKIIYQGSCQYNVIILTMCDMTQFRRFFFCIDIKSSLRLFDQIRVTSECGIKSAT